MRDITPEIKLALLNFFELIQPENRLSAIPESVLPVDVMVSHLSKLLGPLDQLTVMDAQSDQLADEYGFPHYIQGHDRQIAMAIIALHESARILENELIQVVSRSEIRDIRKQINDKLIIPYSIYKNRFEMIFDELPYFLFANQESLVRPMVSLRLRTRRGNGALFSKNDFVANLLAADTLKKFVGSLKPWRNNRKPQDDFAICVFILLLPLLLLLGSESPRAAAIYAIAYAAFLVIVSVGIVAHIFCMHPEFKTEEYKNGLLIRDFIDSVIASKEASVALPQTEKTSFCDSVSRFFCCRKGRSGDTHDHDDANEMHELTAANIV